MSKRYSLYYYRFDARFAEGAFTYARYYSAA